MKTANAIKAMERAGLKVQKCIHNARRHFAIHGKYCLAFFDQDGEAICINVTNQEAKAADSNPMNGNCYTSYPSNLKRALNYIGANIKKHGADCDCNSCERDPVAVGE